MAIQLFRNGRIYTPVDRGKALRGREQGRYAIYQRGSLLVVNGVIAGIGDDEDILQFSKRHHIDEERDLRGRCLVPGFVDPHTHMCFAALREKEFERRLGGTSYLKILEEGGGILSSVKSVAAASTTDLADVCRKHAGRALQLGTTTLEIKSGYGLDTANELKMLEAIGRVAQKTPQDIVPTFLGAHAVPPSFQGAADDYITLIIEEMLPAVIRQGIAKHCDIFCEEGVFSIEQGRRLLQAARAQGMEVKLHADEVHDLGGAGLAAELQALSADHLLAANDKNLTAMAKAGVVATLLPATAFSLQKPYARARAMIDSNIALALATDCNPGSSYTESMQFVIGLAVLNMQMTPAEALCGATLNAAYAIGMAEKVGSLDVGKQADFLVLDGETPAILAYHAGVSSVVEVYKKGVLVAAGGLEIIER